MRPTTIPDRIEERFGGGEGFMGNLEAIHCEQSVVSETDEPFHRFTTTKDLNHPDKAIYRGLLTLKQPVFQRVMTNCGPVYKPYPAARVTDVGIAEINLATLEMECRYA